MNYYQDKLESLREIFGTENVSLNNDILRVDGNSYPILDDVIILIDPSHYTPYIRSRLLKSPNPASPSSDFAENIQHTFGSEWNLHSEIMPEHKGEFAAYFDVVDLESLKAKRVCDLGCGSGRWSYFLVDRCRELVLVDFSDAVFVARRNLSRATRSLFFMADIQNLPFRNDFCDFLFCLGVLHHLPEPCLKAARRIRPMARQILFFIYYALDNRPWHYPLVLSLVTRIRLAVSPIRSGMFRSVFCFWTAVLVYEPLVLLGWGLKPFGLSSYIPLYDFYHGKGFRRILQDVYDRFFTGIEQRVTRRQILELRDTYSSIQISEHLPYWHFICKS